MGQSGRPSLLGAWGAALVLALAFGLVASARPAAAATAPVLLKIRIVHAHNDGTVVDPKLQDLVKDFSALKFTSYQLKDEASFKLELGALGRMQLPNEAWMTVQPLERTADGMLRLELEVKDLKFKTVVAIAEGATLAIGGPPYGSGALILAVTRPKPGTMAETPTPVAP